LAFHEQLARCLIALFEYDELTGQQRKRCAQDQRDDDKETSFFHILPLVQYLCSVFNALYCGDNLPYKNAGAPAPAFFIIRRNLRDRG